MNRKGFIKCGDIIVSKYGDVCCSNTNCPQRSIVGRCTDVNANCKHEKDRDQALLTYMFPDDDECL